MEPRPIAPQLTAEEWRAEVARHRDADGLVPATLAWQAANGLYLGGDSSASAEVLDAADVEHAAPVDLARIEAGRATLAFSRGDAAGCRRHAERAMSWAEESGDAGALAVSWVVRALDLAMAGDRAGNRAAYLRALETGDGDPLLQVRIRINLGSSLTESGLFARAVEQLTLGLELAEEQGLTWHMALLRLNLGAALAGLGRLDEALVETALARDLWTSVGSSWASAAWELRGRIQSARGDLVDAVTALRAAVAVAERTSDHQTLAPSLAALARTVTADDLTEAQQIAERLLALPAPLGTVEARLAAGWVALAADDAAPAARHARDALTEALTREDRPGQAEALLLTALSEGDADETKRAAAIWDELGNPIQRTVAELVGAHLAGDALGRLLARDELRLLGVHDDAWRCAGPLNAVRRALPDVRVRVHTVGSPVVYRAGTRVRLTEAVGSLLRRLVAEGTTAATAAEVEELRRMLDPEGVLPPERVVTEDDGLVRLADVHVDPLAFREAARAALAAAAAGSPEAFRLLRSAASLYTDDFLEDGPGEGAASQWARLRQDVVDLGAEVNRALADLLLAGPSPEQAVPWLARILVDDPLDERAYADIVTVLDGAGDRAGARRYSSALAWRRLSSPPD